VARAGRAMWHGRATQHGQAVPNFWPARLGGTLVRGFWRPVSACLPALRVLWPSFWAYFKYTYKISNKAN